MTQTKSKNMLLYKLLDIKTESGKIWLLILPPIYALWLLAIGKKLLQRQNKPDKTFTIFASLTVIFFTIAFFIAPLLKLFEIDIIVTDERMKSIVFAIFFFWFGTTSMLSSLTVNYERLVTPERYYSLVDKFDYVKRFFAFFYWPFSIWTYQKTVNEYNK